MENTEQEKQRQGSIDMKTAAKNGRFYWQGKGHKKVPYVGTKNVEPILDAIEEVMVKDAQDGNMSAGKDMSGCVEHIKDKAENLIDFLNLAFKLKRKYNPKLEGEEYEKECRAALADLFDEEEFMIGEQEFEFMEAWFDAIKKDVRPERKGYKGEAEIAAKTGLAPATVRAYRDGIASYVASELRGKTAQTGSSSDNYGKISDRDEGYLGSGDADDSGLEDAFYSGMNTADNERGGSGSEYHLFEEYEKDYLSEEDDIDANIKDTNNTDILQEKKKKKAEDEDEPEPTDDEPSDEPADDEGDSQERVDEDENGSAVKFDSVKSTVESFFDSLKERIDNDRKYFEDTKASEELMQDEYEAYGYKSPKEAIKDLKAYNAKRLKALAAFEKTFKGMKEELVKKLETLNKDVQPYLKTAGQGGSDFVDDYAGKPCVEELFKGNE